MSLIEKILTTQTIQGPYLGHDKTIQAQPSQGFVQTLKATQAPAPQPLLQSLNQHLSMQVQVKPSVGAGAHVSPLLNPMTIQSQKLTQNTLSQLSQHPVKAELQHHIEEMLVLQALLRVRPRVRQVEQIVPSAFALLSYLPLEKPFEKSIEKRRRASRLGKFHLDFKLGWERNEAPER